MAARHAVLGIELPVVQAPTAGAQGSALAIAVSQAGGLGSRLCCGQDPGGCRAVPVAELTRELAGA